MTREQKESIRARTYKVHGPDLCYACGKECRLEEGQMVCVACGTVNDKMVLETGLAEREHSTISVPSQYRRANHLEAIVEQLTGCTKRDPPPEVEEAVREFIRVHRVDKRRLTPQRVREILKQLKMSSAYRWAAYFSRQLGGRGHLELSREVREKISEMFEQIERAYSICAPVSRQNMLSYRFVVSKSLQLLGVSGGGEISQLKSRQKVNELDAVWRKICEINGWKFTPTTGF